MTKVSVMRVRNAIPLFFAFASIVGCQRGDDAPATPITSSLQSATPAPILPGSEDLLSGDGTLPIEKVSLLDAPGYIRPFPIVMYDKADEEQLKPYAERIAKLTGARIVNAMNANPVCCVWLEITKWTPNPGYPGYIINNQPGGSVIQASDPDQMRLAVERFESTAKRYEDHVTVPMGLLTNYNVQR